MKTQKERTLKLTYSDDEPISKKQLLCFVHNLSADIIRQKPLITWFTSGPNTFYTHGLAEGTLIQLESDGQGEIKFTYNRHGKTVYTAIETNGEVGNLDHIATLYSRVSIMAAPVSSHKAPSKPAESKSSKPDSCSMTIADVINSIDVDELVSTVLDEASMLSFRIASHCAERQRYEALIRSVVSYIEHLKPKESELLMQSFAVFSLKDGKRCGHLVTTPLSQLASCYVKFDEKYYGGLTPCQRNLKFASDFVINLLAGN